MLDLKRLRQENGLTQMALGQILGCGQANISAIEKHGKAIDPAYLHRLKEMYGEDIEERYPLVAVAEMPMAAVVPLLPVEAMAGSLAAWSQGVTANDCQHIVAPMAGADYAIRVTGDSMEPIYRDGMTIFIKRINDRAFIPWGTPLVVDTENGVVVKKLYPVENEETRVIAKSINPEYPPYMIDTASIFGLYRVLGGTFVNTIL